MQDNGTIKKVAVCVVMVVLLVLILIDAGVFQISNDEPQETEKTTFAPHKIMPTSFKGDLSLVNTGSISICITNSPYGGK